MPEPYNYAAILQAGKDLFPDIVNEGLKQQLLAAQVQGTQAQAADTYQQARQRRAAQDQDEAYQGALDQYLLDPTPEGALRLITRFPDRAKEVKSGWDTLDKGRQSIDLRQMSEIYSAAKNGNYALAAKNMRTRVDADKAADGQADPQDEAILAALESGDPVQQKAALGMIGVSVASITGPEHFGATYGQLAKGITPDIRNVQAGDEVISVDPETGVAKRVYASPYIKDASGALIDRSSVEGGDQSGDVVEKIIGAEGTGDNPRSSANGIGQFTDGTWLKTYKSHFGGEGMTNAQILALKTDPNIARQMTALHTKDNQAGLTAAGIQPTDGNTYLAHFLGLGGAKAVLTANPNAPIGNIVGQAVVKANPFLQGKTVADTIAWANNKMGAGGKPKVVLPGKQDAPSGYRYTAGGNLEPIPGGPAAKPSYQLLTPEENVALGLDPNVRYQRSADGQITALGGQSKAQLKPIPSVGVTGIQENRDTLRQIDRAIAAVKKRPQSIGFGTGMMGDYITQWNDPQGTTTRATVGKIAGQIIHDVSGAAVTLSEEPRFKPYVPVVTDSPQVALDKLQNLRVLAQGKLDDLMNYYSEEQGYRPYLPPPVKVRSVQEAMKLPKGTVFIDPNGVKRVR